MDASEITNWILGGLTTVVAFFLVQFYLVILRMKTKQQEDAIALASLQDFKDKAFVEYKQNTEKIFSEYKENANKSSDEFKTLVFKKFSSININHDKQSDINAALRETLTIINTKLDMLLEGQGKKK